MNIETGKKFLKEKNYLEAEKIFLNLLNKDENLLLVNYFLGGIYFELQNYKKSKFYYEKGNGSLAVRKIDHRTIWLLSLGNLPVGQWVTSDAKYDSRAFEGFYNACHIKNTDRKHGVIIPKSNQHNLMLNVDEPVTTFREYLKQLGIKKQLNIYMRVLKDKRNEYLPSKTKLNQKKNGAPSIKFLKYSIP